jgi:hypothetical protein
MRPELRDSDISRELVRRSSGDWHAERVLPAVRRAMEEPRTDRVATSRWAALAALVGLLGVLVLLAVALPRLDLAPAAPSPTPAGGVVVLSTEEFAARLATGDLDGSSVLVDGRIEADDRPSIECSRPSEPCPLGVLAGVDERVQVHALGVATDDPDAASLYLYSEEAWAHWRMPEPPIEGVLVLALDRFGSVNFLGTVTPAGADVVSWPPAAVADLDAASVAVDAAVIVEGWLTQVPGAMSCRPPDPGTVLEGLPDKWCGNPAWIAPEPVTLDPEGYSPPGDGLSVQHGAMHLVRGDRPAVGPVQGRFIVARRLYGGGCPDNAPPCWDWRVIGALWYHDPTSGQVPPDSATPRLPTPGVTDAPETPPAEARPGTWELAPAEFPSATSRSLEVVVHETACASGLSPEDRILPPHVEYGPTSISIRFMIVPLPGIQACPGAPGAPMRVELTEPIGSRTLLDAGTDPPVERLAFEQGLRVVTLAEGFPYEFGDERLHSLLGPAACIETIWHDREEDTADFERWAADVAGGDGLTPNGFAWLGDASDAARAFGAFELHLRTDQLVSGGAVTIMAMAAQQTWLGSGEDGRLATNIAPGSVVMADMYGQRLRDGRNLWIVAHARHSAGGPSCPSEGGVIVNGPMAIATSGDFDLQLRAGTAAFQADEPIDVEATLTYHGATGETVDGWGNGYVWFRVERVDGELRMEPVQMMICQRLVPLEAGVPRTMAFFKGGYGLAPGDPNADFLRRYWEDPELRLPAGAWRITATSSFGIGDCGQQWVRLEASIIVQVR